jgi:hypothetical protein
MRRARPSGLLFIVETKQFATEPDVSFIDLANVAYLSTSNCSALRVQLQTYKVGEDA